MSRKAKKVVGLILSLTLLCAMSINVFAKGSVVSYGAVGINCDVDITVKATDKKPTTDDMKSALGDKYVDGMYVYETMDITPVTEVTEKQSISFQVPVVSSTTKAAVLHYENGQWQNVTSSVGDGYILAMVDSFSPFAIIVDDATQVNGGGTGGTGGSPKTGEFATTSVLAVLAVLAMGGAVVCYRKREEVR